MALPGLDVAATTALATDVLGKRPRDAWVREVQTRTAGNPYFITEVAHLEALWCLPQSRVDPDCEAPDTVMRPAIFGAIAKQAGWSGFEVLPIEHPFWRFYRLTR